MVQSKLKKKIISQIEINIPTYKENELPEDFKVNTYNDKPGSRDLK